MLHGSRLKFPQNHGFLFLNHIQERNETQSKLVTA